MAILAQKEYVATPYPEVFPGSDLGYLLSPHDDYIFPEIYLATLKKCFIYGSSNFIFNKKYAVHHDLYSFDHDYTSEELHQRAVVFPEVKKIKWFLDKNKAKKVSIAAAFTDSCAANYAHWLTELLPRINLFCQLPECKNIPIIVDAELHENIKESLHLVAGKEREIIFLSKNTPVYIEKLYNISVTGYVPFGRRSSELSGHSHGYFSPRALQCLCSDLFGHVASLSNITWPKKIYIRRVSAHRRLINSAEIEKILVERGYTVVQPEKLSFLEQVKLFSSAEYIIGATGAAMANIIFAKAHAKILILISKYSGTSYWYWQNMARASGKTIDYLLGEIDNAVGADIHADFSVNANLFRLELENYL